MGFSNPHAIYAVRTMTGAVARPDHTPPQGAIHAAANRGDWRPSTAVPTEQATASCATGTAIPASGTAPGQALADLMPSVFDGLPVPRDLNAVVEYLRQTGRQGVSPQDGQAKPGISALFSSYFNAVMEQAPHLSGAAADTAMQALIQLASAVREGTLPDEEPARCMRARRVDAVRQFVEDNLHRADLTPARAARALGMSVRQLHLLFEPSDTSFSRYMLARRLERSRTLLAQQPNRSVLDIMLACGIESSTVFYRGFRKAFGMNPTDFRRTISGEN